MMGKKKDCELKVMNNVQDWSGQCQSTWTERIKLLGRRIDEQFEIIDVT